MWLVSAWSHAEKKKISVWLLLYQVLHQERRAGSDKDYTWNGMTAFFYQSSESMAPPNFWFLRFYNSLILEALCSDKISCLHKV